MNKKYCKCGCGEEIKVKFHHKYYGTPEYISGHNWKDKERGNRSRNSKIKQSETRKYLFKTNMLKVWNKGKKLSYYHILELKKNHKGMIGKKHKIETIRKIRESKIKYVENQLLNGMPLSPTIGMYEKVILDNLEECFNYNILRQYKINGYFLDGYCPALNLAIEIDEPFHNNRIEKDIVREKEISNKLNCQFLRIKVGEQ